MTDLELMRLRLDIFQFVNTAFPPTYTATGWPAESVDDWYNRAVLPVMNKIVEAATELC